MPGAALSRVLLVAGAASLVAVIPATAIWLVREPGGAMFSLPFVAWFVAGAVAWRLRPDRLAARRLLAFGACTLAWVTLAFWLGIAVEERGVEGWFVPANAVMVLIDLTFLGTFVALCAVYPDGRRQRAYEPRVVRMVFAVGALAAAGLLLATERVHRSLILVWMEERLGPLDEPNPLHVDALAWLAPPLEAYAAAMLAVLPVTGAVLLALRFRRFPRAQRLQIAWPFLAALLIAATGPLDLVVTAGVIPQIAADAVEVAALLVAPALFAIGIVRPGVLDVERLLRRSLLYGALWVAIAAAYVGAAAALGIAASSGSVQVAVLVTVAATLLFQPVWRHVLAIAARRVYGERLGGEELVRRIGDALEHTLDLEELAAAVAATVREGLGVRWVRVVVDGEAIAVAGAPAAGEEAALAAPLEPGASGRIECGGHPSGELRAADREVLATLGRQAGLALGNATLARELARRASELEASRARIVEAEERGRRRIERDIHDGVQQELVALIARIGLARAQLARDPGALDATLGDLRSEAQQALADLRELAGGIHPSVLTDRGIVEAVEARAARLPLGVTIECDRALRDTRFPETVEGAAYFVVCEGFANALKHSGAERVVVRIADEGTALSLEVADDGRGFDPAAAAAAAAGSGLAGLADRIDALGGSFGATSAPGAGTTLTVRLPVAERVHA